MPMLYLLSDLAYFIAYRLIRYRKKVVLENMARAFPEKTEEEIKSLAKSFYKRFADFALETLKALSISEAELKRRVVFRNLEVLTPYHEKGRSVVLAASHQFNWEWALLAGCIQLPYKVDGIYQKLSNKSFDKLIYDMRSRFGGTPIPKKSALRSVIRRKSMTKAVAINGDQVPQKSKQNTYWTIMLHQDTAFFRGVETISQLLEGPAFFIHIQRVKRGYYAVTFEPLGVPPYEKGQHEVLENYIKASERLILEDPAGWLWSHKRWKYKKPIATPND